MKKRELRRSSDNACGPFLPGFGLEGPFALALQAARMSGCNASQGLLLPDKRQPGGISMPYPVNASGNAYAPNQ